MSVFQLFFTYISDLVSPYAWSISRAVWPSTGNFGNFSFAGQDTSPEGLFFKPDGTRMYMLGDASGQVYEYALATAWDVTTATFTAAKDQNTPREVDPRGIFFKPDGLAFYIVGTTNDAVNEYTLTSAWDITTASYTRRFSVNAQEISPESVFFSPDGARMYVTGGAGDDVNEYALTTAWNVLTASFVRVFSVAAQETNPTTLFFKPDGTRMYVAGNNRTIYEYTLTTPWNVSTASFIQNSVLLSEHIQGLNTASIFFKDDGTELFIINSLNDSVHTFIVQIPWNITTISPKRPTFFANVAVQTSTPQDLFFHPDGTRMYVISQVPDAVTCYELGNAWSIDTSRYLNEFNVEAQETTPTGLFFKSDGTRMYIVGTASDTVRGYLLSTAWDVSTAVYIAAFSVAAQETTPSALFFKPDGSRMYLTGTTGDDVNEYLLATAWDISTASYVQNFSVAAQETNPSGLFFKPDGSRMYLTGTGFDDVKEYLLATAWDISTASYVQNFSVAAQETNPTGLFFKPDGSRMYIVGFSSDAVYEYVIE